MINNFVKQQNLKEKQKKHVNPQKISEMKTEESPKKLEKQKIL